MNIHEEVNRIISRALDRAYIRGKTHVPGVFGETTLNDIKYDTIEQLNALFEFNNLSREVGPAKLNKST